MQIPSKLIYLIRHGQTDYNLQGIVQGSRVDTDLNQMGLKQSEDFFNMYQSVKFDKIYTSKLKRTVQSVQRFIDLGIPHEAYSGLNEISWGEQDGVVSNAQMHDYYVQVTKEWQDGNLDLQIGGGESPNEVAARQKPVFDHILAQHNEKKILVAMHGRAIRILLCTLLGKSLTQMDTFEHTNLGLYILSYDSKRFTLIKSNDKSHLK